MINLLPPAEKQKLLLATKDKLAIILGIVVSVGLVCLILVLLSVKFYILAQTNYQKSTLAQTEQGYQTPDSANLNNTIQKYNGILAELDSFYKKEIYFSQAFKIITDVPNPKGLYLTNFSLTREENGNIQVNISGVSDTRDNLLIFKQSIEADKQIKNPYFSPESWVSPKNVNFRLAFEVYQNEKQQ